MTVILRPSMKFEDFFYFSPIVLNLENIGSIFAIGLKQSFVPNSSLTEKTGDKLLSKQGPLLHSFHDAKNVAFFQFTTSQFSKNKLIIEEKVQAN